MACGVADTHQHKMKMDVADSSKTSALVYQTTWTHITDSGAQPQHKVHVAWP